MEGDIIKDISFVGSGCCGILHGALNRLDLIQTGKIKELIGILRSAHYLTRM